MKLHYDFLLWNMIKPTQVLGFDIEDDPIQ